MRSRWIGILCLVIAGIVATATLFLIVSDHSLADVRDDLNGLAGRDNDDNNLLPTATETPEQPIPEITALPETTEISANAAFVIQLEHDVVLYEKNADEPFQPASTAKLITALTVLQYASPDEVVEIAESDVVDPVLESSMGLRAGDRVTIHDLIVGMMLPSGNDAAGALSRVIGERIPDEAEDNPDIRFINAMNETAAAIGMEDSTFLHSAGHDRDGQVVTARDMAIATKAVLERPSLIPIVAMRRAEIRVGGPYSRVITIDNTNELLVYDGVYGVKTGTTTEAGQSLIAAWRDDDGTTIAVILGSEDRYGDARRLLNLGEPPESPTKELDPELEDAATP